MKSSPPAKRDFTCLTDRRHDVLIIGGGINGAGLARDLAMRGASVALVDQGDFGAGTSSASTKLIHGGLRYLERFQLGLVSESCRERRILQKIAPHLVRPLSFLIPVYRQDPRPLWMIRAGLTLYDLLALFRNTHPHRILSPEQGRDREPVLEDAGLTGVALYWDCRTDDARLVLENVLAARQAGAQAVNYLQATGFLRHNGRLGGARLRDPESGAELEVEARVVVNATGPWLDQVCALDGQQEQKLRPSRGTHILVPRLGRGDAALYLTAGRDDRLFFVIPWSDGLSLVGTTDVEDQDDPGRVVPTAGDIEYLLGEAGRHLRGAAPGRGDVVAAFSGLRPLVATEGGRGIGKASREHRLYVSASGLLSIGGGKYTTYRAVAREAADRVMELLGRPAGRCGTDRVPLPGGVTGDFGAFVRRRLPDLVAAAQLPVGLALRLLERYGSRIDVLLALLNREPELCRPVAPGSSLLAAEVAMACDEEWARTPGDVLRRRTSLALGPGRGEAELEPVAELMARRLGGAAPPTRWVEDYRRRYLATI